MGVLCGWNKISRVRVDVDKDWKGKGISNIKEIAEAMATGHTTQFDGARLIKLVPGIDQNVLTSQGAGKLVIWSSPGSYFHRFFPVTIDLSHAQAIVAAAKSHEKAISLATSHKQAYGDAPADYIKRLTPAVVLVDAEAIVAADQSHNKNAPVASELALEYPVGGAKLEDGGVFTDYTTEINEASANDVHLLPVCSNGGLVIDDASYFGLDKKWGQLWLDIGVPAVGNFALAHEYWDGAAWSALAGFIDNTSEFTISGKHNMKWTVPGDWALKLVDGVNLYWIRARVIAVATYTTQPLGTQGWCEVIV
ncbi:hypothetical protein ES703_35116 [subsurface metagenome]